MRVTVLGSGSRGNAMLVESDDGALLIDAGFSHKVIEARLAAAGRTSANVRAIVLTHEHGDHSRGASRAARTWGVPLAASRGTLRALEWKARPAPIALDAARACAVAGFRVTAYPITHDAADPVMLVVEDGAGQRLGVAFDIGTATTALRHALRGLDAVVIESNHDEVMLRSSSYPASVRSRIAGIGGHLSNRQTAELLAACAHPGLGLVVLAHLSELCNRADIALGTVQDALKATPFAGRIVVAAQDAPTATLDIGATQLSFPLR